jgi:hypothetical protein
VMKVTPRPGLASNMVAVRLEAASHTDADGNVIPEITWGKMIIAWNYRRNTGLDTISVNMGSTGVGPIERIVRTGCDATNTLIFSKQKFLGTWTWMYTLAIAGVPSTMQSEEFSKAFGVKELHFTWKLDNVYNGSIGYFSL